MKILLLLQYKHQFFQSYFEQLEVLLWMRFKMVYLYHGRILGEWELREQLRRLSNFIQNL
jgi:hypothetical protein